MNQSEPNDDLDAQFAKARRASTTWAALSGAGAIVAAGTLVAGALPAAVALGIASVLAAWRYLGVSDQVQHLEHRVAARNGTGAGQLWAGK